MMAAALLFLLLAISGCTAYEEEAFNLKPVSKSGFNQLAGCTPTDQGKSTRECLTTVNGLDEPKGIEALHERDSFPNWGIKTR